MRRCRRAPCGGWECGHSSLSPRPTASRWSRSWRRRGRGSCLDCLYRGQLGSTEMNDVCLLREICQCSPWWCRSPWCGLVGRGHRPPCPWSTPSASCRHCRRRGTCPEGPIWWRWPRWCVPGMIWLACPSRAGRRGSACQWSRMRNSPQISCWKILVNNFLQFNSDQSTSRAGAEWKENCCLLVPVAASQMMVVLSTPALRM